jgi:hypothetical protein
MDLDAAVDQVLDGKPVPKVACPAVHFVKDDASGAAGSQRAEQLSKDGTPLKRCRFLLLEPPRDGEP